MKFKCRKVSSTTGAYVDSDNLGTPMRCFEAHFEPVESQHGNPGGIAELRLWVWGSCKFERGRIYEFEMKVEASVEAQH